MNTATLTVATDRLAWQAEAEKVVRLVAAASNLTGQTFTSNEVWDTGLLSTPANSRWLGPVMQRLSREGVIAKVADGALSERGHGSRMNGYWLGLAV